MKRKQLIIILSVLTVVLSFINQFGREDNPADGLIPSNIANVYHSSTAPTFNLGEVKVLQFLVKKSLRSEHNLTLNKDHKFMILEQASTDSKNWKRYSVTIQSFVEATVNFPQFSVETKDLSTSKVTKTVITTLPKQVKVISNILDNDTEIERAPLMTLAKAKAPEDEGFNYLLLLLPVIILVVIIFCKRTPKVVEEDPQAELKAVIAALRAGKDISPNQLRFNNPVVDTFFYAKNNPESRENLIQFLESQLGGQNES